MKKKAHVFEDIAPDVPRTYPNDDEDDEDVSTEAMNWCTQGLNDFVLYCSAIFVE